MTRIPLRSGAAMQTSGCSIWPERDGRGCLTGRPYRRARASRAGGVGDSVELLPPCGLEIGFTSRDGQMRDAGTLSTEAVLVLNGARMCGIQGADPAPKWCAPQAAVLPAIASTPGCSPSPYPADRDRIGSIRLVQFRYGVQIRSRPAGPGRRSSRLRPEIGGCSGSRRRAGTEAHRCRSRTIPRFRRGRRANPIPKWRREIP